MKRTFLKQTAALTAAGVAAPAALAQSNWPTKPIHILVPYPPGGTTDPVARVIGHRLSEALGQSVVVENRAGGNTSIAGGAVARADPDGYLLFFTSVSTHVIHTVQRNYGYDPIKDFVPIAGVSRAGYMMGVHVSVPAKTLPELIAYAKANPKKLNFSVSGIGNANHLATEMFKMAAGIDITVVPYKGGGPAMIDLAAGRVQCSITVAATLQPLLDAGKIRPLAYNSQEPGMPPVPTFAQYGLKGFESFETVNILLAPARTPQPIINRMASAIEAALKMPETQKSIALSKQTASYLGPQALAARLASDQATFLDIIKKANIKLSA